MVTDAFETGGEDTVSSPIRSQYAKRECGGTRRSLISAANQRLCETSRSSNGARRRYSTLSRESSSKPASISRAGCAPLSDYYLMEHLDGPMIETYFPKNVLLIFRAELQHIFQHL